ncbi:MAG: hypothetical protein HY560_01745 [Gemmatimonadetes bacterium]|nr:hypothetical protein [Gemmatimonadota bacterium]
MIHCTTEDLIALKDREGTAWARRHLADCEECRREFDALHQRVAQLKALPSLHPPRDRWPAIRARVLAARRAKMVKRARWATVALAASMAAVITVQAVRDRPVDLAQSGDLEQLMVQSQRLEQTLRELNPESRVLNGVAAGAVAELEDRIAAVDARLGVSRTAPRDERADLWRRRVELMQGLVSVHATRVAYLGM